MSRLVDHVEADVPSALFTQPDAYAATHGVTAGADVGAVVLDKGRKMISKGKRDEGRVSMRVVQANSPFFGPSHA